MIRRILQFIIFLILANTSLYINDRNLCIDKLDKLNSYLKTEGCKAEAYDEIVMIFDYDKIEKYLDENIENYSVNKISEMGFLLTIEVKKGIFSGEIKREFFIKRGDLYVDWN